MSETIHSLRCCYNAEFEKLGWMILHKHSRSKIADYKNSIKHLIASLAAKIKVTHDPDRVADLKIMHANTIILSNHVERDLK